MNIETFNAARSRWSESELFAKLAETPIPEYMHSGIVHYITAGRPVGHFLTAIFSNDLREACSRADGVNQPLIFDYVRFMTNNAPAGCWGSPDRVSEWFDLGLAALKSITTE